MIDRLWRDTGVSATWHPSTRPYTHLTWEDPAGDQYVAKPGDNPDDPLALIVVEVRNDGDSKTILYGRPVGHPEAELERHEFRLAALP